MARLLALALAALTLLPATARACWTGLSATTAGVELQFMDDAAGTWEPARMQSFATWVTRVDAIAPDDLHILATERHLIISCSGCKEENVPWDGELATLFERVATVVGVDRATRRRALALATTAYTVQVAAFADRADADALALRLNEREEHLGVHGFVEIGAFPSFNPAAHVVAVDCDGAPVYRVLVGAFLSRADAEAAQAEVRDEAGIRGFVRPLV